MENPFKFQSMLKSSVVVVIVSKGHLFLHLRIQKQLNYSTFTTRFMSLPHTYIPHSITKSITCRTRRKISEERDNLCYGIFKCLKEKFLSLMKIMLDFRAPTSPLLIFLGGVWSRYLIWLLQRCPCKENKPREIPNPKEQTWRGLEHALSNLRSKLSKYES